MAERSIGCGICFVVPAILCQRKELVLVLSNQLTIVISSNDGNVREQAPLVMIASVAAFVMTMMIIVLVMQGNHRTFYHEQVVGMQSGLIKFMAEIVENRDDNTGGHIRRTADYVECIAKVMKNQGAYRDILTDRYLSDMAVADVFDARTHNDA